MNINKVFSSPIVYLLIIVFGGGYWFTNYIAMQTHTVSVSGYADSSVNNEVASFSAGVSSVNDKKEVAVNEVNTKIDEIIKGVKFFGVSSDDIKTQSINIYQQEESYYDYSDNNSVQKSRPGQWRVSNTIEIKLKDASRTSDLVDLLTQSGATNVYGPNFSIEDTSSAENDLVGLAIKDATVKASEIASQSGRKLGKIINVSEGSSPVLSPMMSFESARGGGGSAVEAGTSTVSKTLYVTFELL